MKTTLIAIAAAGALAAPAIAGNLEPAPRNTRVAAPAPAAPAGVDWTGPYVGAQIGYGTGDADGPDLDGVFGGGLAGYNFDMGGWVLGGEVDYNAADLGIDGGGTIEQLGRAKLRAGYEVGNALPYLAAGGAYAADDGSDDGFGYAVGAGLDILFTERLVGGIEYLYHDFNDFGSANTDVTVNTIAARAIYKF